MDAVVGRGSLELPLSEADVRGICEDAIERLPVTGKRVLVLIPDNTRHARLDLLFRLIVGPLQKRADAVDVLVASGTHAPMSIELLCNNIGITMEERKRLYANVRFFQHEHRHAGELAALGVIDEQETSRLTNGALVQPIRVTINRKVLEYDHLILVTPVVPHETVGFAGGNKYFFPGIAGIEVIETFHWIGALLTNPVVNGVRDTLTRRIIDRATELIPTPRTCFAYVLNADNEPVCLFAGDPIHAWSQAVEYSARTHITYVDHPYRKVLAVTPEIYEDLWVGGKAMYKLEPVVADGGEVIILGPQIRAISFVHEEAIRKIGYHVIEYFTRQWDRFAGEPKLIMAHSTNVRGVGTFDQGSEHPRISVTLATSIPADVCRSVNLGYLEYRTVRPDEWRRQQDPDVLVVENAGQNLYRLRESGSTRNGAAAS